MNPHQMTWGFAYGFQFAFIIGALTVVAWIFSKEPKKIPIRTLTVLMGTMLVWISVTTFYAEMPDLAYVKWKQNFKILGFTLVTVALMYTRERLDALIWVIVLSIGFFAVKGGLFTILSGGSFRVWGPPNSMIEDNNALALATIMVVPLARYLHMHAKNRWIRYGLLLSMPLMVASAVGSYSRGAFVAMSVMALFMWQRSRHRIWIGIVIAIVASGVISLMPDKYFARIDTIGDYQEDASAMGRIEAWTFAARYAADHPILGGGFGVFGNKDLWDKYLDTYARVRSPHSIYFEVLGQHGFVGLGIFLLVGAMALWNAGWIVRRAKTRPDLLWARDLGAMTQASLAGYATGGAFLNLAFLDLYWHLVAIVVIARVLVERALSAAPAMEPATAAMAGRQPKPVSFLRKPGSGTRPYRRSSVGRNRAPKDSSA